MKSKNEGSIPATIATTATREAEGPKPAGLLGGEPDVFAGLGLGLGASPEARRLVLLGLVSERMAEIDRRLAGLKPGRGRPTADVTIDMKRAAAVLAADDLWRDKTGKGLPSQKAAVHLAVQLEGVLEEVGKREECLFGNGDLARVKPEEMKRWQTSVSKGLRELGLRGERFSKK
jgi:hypothetical protein